MAAAAKTREVGKKSPAVKKAATVETIDLEIEPTDSPARQLQENLEATFDENASDDYDISPRMVTLGVIGFCTACWGLGFYLYSLL